jgi:hypothetical protein
LTIQNPLKLFKAELALHVRKRRFKRYTTGKPSDGWVFSFSSSRKHFRSNQFDPLCGPVSRRCRHQSQRWGSY